MTSAGGAELKDCDDSDRTPKTVLLRGAPEYLNSADVVGKFRRLEMLVDDVHAVIL